MDNKKFLVTWQISVEASTPLTAALAAERYSTQYGLTTGTMEIIDLKTANVTIIGLNQEKEADLEGENTKTIH